MVYVKIYDSEMRPCGVAAFEQDIIKALIPEGTTILNPLANMSFVTTAIATSTATFRGTYETLAELQAVTDADDNDYGYVEDVDEYGNMFYKRYKFNGEEWEYEFSLSNTQFNQSQWGAINSGVTSDDITKLSTLPTSSELTVLLNDKQDAIGDLQTIRNQAANAAPQDTTYTKTEVNNLITTPNQEYVSVIATSQTTSVTDVLPATGAADTTYRVGNWDGTQYNDSVFSEYAWNGSAYIKLSTKSQIGEVYDISANHADDKYADLAAALGTNGANIPDTLRKGGMSVKYVCSSDNKYVQYRLMADSFTTDTTQWAIDDNSILVEDPEYIRVFTDKDIRVLFGIKTDGSVDWAIGVPAPVKEYIDGEILSIYKGSNGNNIDGLSKVISFLSELSSNSRLKEILDDIEDRTPDDVEDPEYITMTTDSQNKILEGISNGVKRIEIPCAFGSDVSFDKNLPNQIVDYVDFQSKGSRIADILQQCKCPDQQTNVAPPAGYKTPQLCLIHYSDIHKDYDRTKRIMAFKEKYREYIDDILLTGDSCNYFSDYNDEILSIEGYSKVLNVIGNHDVYADAGGTTIVTPQQKYERWMMGKTDAQSQNDFISNWGVVQPEGAGENGYYPCYYYKDYTAMNIRLIVIDCMESYGDGGSARDAVQLSWFTEVLSDAKTKGFHVIVSDHYPVGNDINDYTQLNGAFNYLSNPTYGSGYKIDDYADAIDTFINEDGGIFVCWLCGHLHYDFTAFANSHPKQLYLAVPTANINAHISFRRREVGNENEDCFNIVAVDTETKTIRVARIGSQFDRFLQHQGTMCISYDTSESANPSLIYHF